MIIGVPKEIKDNENRVALTPAGTRELAKRGHTVYIEQNAGFQSGFADEEYISAGATMLQTAAEVFAKADMIMKVKEPIAQEYGLIRPNQLVFTYFHFASYEPLTKAMIDSGAVCLAYETVELPDRSLPLLIPMSEVAGRMAVQEGAKYLEKPAKGRGVLLGGVPGVAPGKVLVPALADLGEALRLRRQAQGRDSGVAQGRNLMHHAGRRLAQCLNPVHHQEGLAVQRVHLAAV